MSERRGKPQAKDGGATVRDHGRRCARGPAAGPVMTVGSFDGVHRGHRRVFQEARTLSEQLGTTWGVVTFDPPPAVVLGKVGPRSQLTPLGEKLGALKRLGVPVIEVLTFDQALSRLSPSDFLDLILERRFKVQGVVEGENFRFGQGAQGTVAQLEAWARAHAVPVRIVPRSDGSEESVISSSRIRTLIAQGDVAGAEALLGRPYAVTGVVVPGDGRGSTIGFPTANLDLPADKLMPPFGVYAGWVELAGGDPPRPAVANWGERPTFQGQVPRFEVHILKYNGPSLVGQSLHMSLTDRLRGERKFASVEQLVQQIGRDVAAAEARLR